MTFGERIKTILYNGREVALGFATLFSYLAVLAGVALLIYRYGFILTEEDFKAIYANLDILFASFAFIYFFRLLFAIHWGNFIRESWVEGLLVSFIVANGLSNYFFDFRPLLYYLELFSFSDPKWSYQNLLSIYLVILLGVELTKISAKLSGLDFKPASAFISSFVILIAIGTGLLMLPAMTYGNGGSVTYYDSMPFTDALFTSVSASCVTGLAVEDTTTFFTQKGQLVIMMLIQFGGIGIVSFATFFATFLNKGVGLKHQSMIQDFLSSESLISAKTLLRRIIIITLTIEFLGCVFLFFSWDSSLQFKSLGQKIFYSLFHSISAFCNAGFSLFPSGLFTSELSTDITNPYTRGEVFAGGDVVMRSMYSVHFFIAILIILGSIGFGTIEDLLTPSKIRERLAQPWKPVKLSTRIAVSSMVVLVLVGTIGFMVLESHQLRDRTIIEALNTSFFQSVTCRTAGFNTMNFAEPTAPGETLDEGDPMGLQYATIILCIFLMFIGAAPGSTGGGIKSSTFWLIVRSSFASIKGQERIEIGKRTIPTDLVRKAFSIFMFATTYNVLAIFLLSITESGNGDISVVEIVFEQVSAFATAGLSLGITGDLSVAGKYIIIVSMYIGRVGTLTLALALSNKVMTNSYRYPEGHVMVG